MALSKIPNYLQDLIDSDAIGSSAISSAKISSLPTGSVVQVVQSVKTDSLSGAPGAQWLDISGMSVSITPSDTSNKILVLVDLHAAGNAGTSVVRSRLLRDGSPIYIGDAAGNRPRALSQFYIGADGDNTYYMAQLGGSYVDSPSTTSAVNYKVQIGGDTNDRPIRVNQTQGDRNLSNYDSRVASSIIVMEIAG